MRTLKLTALWLADLGLGAVAIVFVTLFAVALLFTPTNVFPWTVVGFFADTGMSINAKYKKLKEATP